MSAANLRPAQVAPQQKPAAAAEAPKQNPNDPRRKIAVIGTARAQTAFFQDLMVYHVDITKVQFPDILGRFWQRQINNEQAFALIEEQMQIDDRLAAHDLLMDSIDCYYQQKMILHPEMVSIVEDFIGKKYSYLESIDLAVTFLVDPDRENDPAFTPHPPKEQTPI